jgi:hypothetical protein
MTWRSLTCLSGFGDFRAPTEDQEAALARSGVDALIKRSDFRRTELLGCEQYATARQLEPGLCAKHGHSHGSVVSERHGSHLELRQRGYRPVQPASQRGADEHLGLGQRARPERLLSDRPEEIAGVRMQGMVSVEVRDQDGGIKHDHSGQS